MARYFFEMSEGDKVIPDDFGSICKDDEKAIFYAYKCLAECVAEPAVIIPWQHAEINVRREDGVEIARISMTVEVEKENPARAAARNGSLASALSSKARRT